LCLAAVTVVFLIVSIPTSFWLHADNNARYGIWKNCELVETNISNDDNKEHFTNQTITCSVTNKGKNKKKKRNRLIACLLFFLIRLLNN